LNKISTGGLLENQEFEIVLFLWSLPKHWNCRNSF